MDYNPNKKSFKQASIFLYLQFFLFCGIGFIFLFLALGYTFPAAIYIISSFVCLVNSLFYLLMAKLLNIYFISEIENE